MFEIKYKQLISKYTQYRSKYIINNILKKLQIVFCKKILLKYTTNTINIIQQKCYNILKNIVNNVL